MQDPVMYVFAGNNGSGKSTIRNLIIEGLGVDINIDPDSIARRLKRKETDRTDIAAGKEAIRLAKECIEKKRSFSIETTLAGKNAIRQIIEARKNGFYIVMFYVGLEDVNLNVNRVALRVKNGGHHIPTEDILRRKEVSIQNLITHLDLIDYLQVIDNTNTGGQIVIEYEKQVLYVANNLPQWAKPILNAMNKKS